MVGRPKLSEKHGSRLTGVRLGEDTRRRIVAYAGVNGMAAFIRDTVVAELDRLGVVDPGPPDAEK
jgi:hypothetical protein